MKPFNINNIGLIAINNVCRHIKFAETTVANMFLKRRYGSVSTHFGKRDNYRSHWTSPCMEVNIINRIAAKDIMNITAKNLKMIEKDTGGLTWSSPVRKIREELGSKEASVPDADAWRLTNLGKLL